VLQEISITPDVISNFTGEPGERLLFKQLRDFLRHDGAIRNLCDGEWEAAVKQGLGSQATKEILEMLLKAPGRCIPFKKSENIRGQAEEWDDEQWCFEASATHKKSSLAGIIATKETAEKLDDPVVSDLLRFPDALWWQHRSPSIRLLRRINAYTDALKPLLRRANSLTFIDPYLDPEREGYRGYKGYADFHKLLETAFGPERNCPPAIEIHRNAEIEGSNGRLRRLTQSDLESRFKNLLRITKQRNVKCTFYLWERFHDRYLLTNLMGILMANGFDSEEDDSLTTWCRMGNGDRDAVQAEFTRNSPKCVQFFEF